MTDLDLSTAIEAGALALHEHYKDFLTTAGLYAEDAGIVVKAALPVILEALAAKAETERVAKLAEYHAIVYNTPNGDWNPSTGWVQRLETNRAGDARNWLRAKAEEARA
ncbi:MAG: hypothetical protein ACTHJM_15925 [Marmoricola sp.]